MYLRTPGASRLDRAGLIRIQHLVCSSFGHVSMLLCCSRGNVDVEPEAACAQKSDWAEQHPHFPSITTPYSVHSRHHVDHHSLHTADGTRHTHSTIGDRDGRGCIFAIIMFSFSGESHPGDSSLRRLPCPLRLRAHPGISIRN